MTTTVVIAKKDYWDVIEAWGVLQGGFIWDWVDQGLQVEVEDEVGRHDVEVYGAEGGNEKGRGVACGGGWVSFPGLDLFPGQDVHVLTSVNAAADGGGAASAFAAKVKSGHHRNNQGKWQKGHVDKDEDDEEALLVSAAMLKCWRLRCGGFVLFQGKAYLRPQSSEELYLAATAATTATATATTAAVTSQPRMYIAPRLQLCGHKGPAPSRPGGLLEVDPCVAMRTTNTTTQLSNNNNNDDDDGGGEGMEKGGAAGEVTTTATAAAAAKTTVLATTTAADDADELHTHTHHKHHKPNSRVNSNKGEAASAAAAAAVYAYGGDLGPYGTPSDHNFCMNGLVQPDRLPNPHAYEVS
jgi:hypothetical protein